MHGTGWITISAAPSPGSSGPFGGTADDLAVELDALKAGVAMDPGTEKKFRLVGVPTRISVPGKRPDAAGSNGPS
jgi:hypothetical protein